MISVLFVCLGNICRSPLAEAIFNKLLAENNLQYQITCDSAGTSDYHIGEKPDLRSIDIAAKNNLVIDHLGRQLTIDDFSHCDYIIAMDKSNEQNIRKLLDSRKHTHIYLMRKFDDQPGDGEVPDPYWSAEDGFVLVHDMLLRSCKNLLKTIIREHHLA